MKLYTRWQNSSGERVRIALHLKNIPFDYVPTSSALSAEYIKGNPQRLVPALEVDGRIIAQSSAILDFLEQSYPAPPLLPDDPILRAQSRAFGAMISSEIHPMTTRRVRRFLQDELKVDDAGVTAWLHNWMKAGFEALERTLANREHAWPFCFGDAPGWADLHLAPQLGNARRYGFDLSVYPILLAIEGRCREVDAFRRAAPENQSDVPG